MVRVIGIGADWCGKCKSAKYKLREYDIEWLDIDRDYCIELIEKHNIVDLPSYIVDDRMVIRSTIGIYNLLRNDKKEKAELSSWI